MTSLPRKVALAPDRDDHDDAQAAAVGHGEGSPPGPSLDAAVVGPPATDPPATDPPATDVPDDPMPGSSGAGVGPADDPAAPDLVAPDPFATPADIVVPEMEAPDFAAPDVADQSVGEQNVVGQDVVDQDVVAPEAGDPAAVGFDGRSPIEATDEAGPDDIGDVSPPAASAPRSRTKTVAVLTVLSLVVVGAGVGGLIWSRNSKKQATPPPTTQASATSPTLSDGAFVTFKDSEAGFSIRYPRGWTRSQAPVAEIRLLVSDGKQFSALIRVTRTDVVTTPANLANVKAVTDGLVGPGAQILKQDPITVNNLIGYRYIYTLTDKDSGLTTAHLHYFLFQGHKMNSIVFEALPSETFSRIEGVFDQMLGSFHSDPEPP